MATKKKATKKATKKSVKKVVKKTAKKASKCAKRVCASVRFCEVVNLVDQIIDNFKAAGMPVKATKHLSKCLKDAKRCAKHLGCDKTGL